MLQKTTRAKEVQNDRKSIKNIIDHFLVFLVAKKNFEAKKAEKQGFALNLDVARCGRVWKKEAFGCNC